MGKQKSHKATAKRFSVTKGGKVKYNQSNRRHKLGLKTPKRKRQLRGGAILSESFAPTIKKLIPYAEVYRRTNKTKDRKESDINGKSKRRSYDKKETQ